MYNVQLPVEGRRLSENQVFFLGVYLAGQVFEAVEPYQFQLAGSVIGCCNHPGGFTGPHRFQITDVCLDLYIRKLRIQFGDRIDPGTVNIPVRDMI